MPALRLCLRQLFLRRLHKGGLLLAHFLTRLRRKLRPDLLDALDQELHVGFPFAGLRRFRDDRSTLNFR